MGDRFDVSRRRTLAGIGGLAVAGGVGYVTLGDGDGTVGDGDGTAWRIAETPITVSLHDTVTTTRGLYAVGDDGVIVARGAGGWETVRDTGVTGDGRDLYAAGVTDDGDRLWVAGASGAIGEYDVVSGSMTEHAAPNDDTDDYRGLAITGAADEAAVYAADAAGHVHYSFENGTAGSWHAVTPGSGASLPAIDFHGPRAGHAIDTNGTVFATDDGETWSRIGIADANVDFYGVDSNAPDGVDVVGGNGMAFHYDGRSWTRTDLGDATFRDVERTGEDGLTVGGGGTVFDLGDGSWEADATPTGANLNAVAIADPTTVVGDGGVVLERE